MGLDLSKFATNLERRNDGIWAARTSSKVSYPARGNDDCFELEDVSFWFRHRNDCILKVVKSFPPPGTFFDVGGGNGFVASALQQAGNDVVLVEPGPSGVANSAKRGVRQIVQSTLYDAGVLPSSLPAVGMFDVLEHVEDDRTLLQDLRRLLIPGGRLYLTVPAFDWLWSQEDIDAGHWRRYTLPKLSALLKESGYHVEFASYFFSYLPLPIFLLRTLPLRLGIRSQTPKTMRSDHETKSGFVQRVLRFVSGRELKKLSSARKPVVGSSCLLVARTTIAES